MLNQIVCAMTKKDTNTEEAILKAAEIEFLEKGFDGAKTVAIAERAGVTHAMLHYYYRSKRNLYDRVLKDKWEMVMQLFLIPFNRTDVDVIQQIKLGIEAHFDFIKANPLLPRFVINEVLLKKDSTVLSYMRKMVSHLYTQLQDKINEAVANGVMKPITVFDLMLDIVSLNLFVFVAKPLIEDITTKTYGSEDVMLEARKRENINVIMCRILK